MLDRSSSGSIVVVLARVIRKVCGKFSWVFDMPVGIPLKAETIGRRPSPRNGEV
jgi:hypothetical protein